jgi:hypothetical protein
MVQTVIQAFQPSFKAIAATFVVRYEKASEHWIRIFAQVRMTLQTRNVSGRPGFRKIAIIGANSVRKRVVRYRPLVIYKRV